MRIGMRMLAIFLSIAIILTMMPSTVLYATAGNADIEDTTVNDGITGDSPEEISDDKASNEGGDEPLSFIDNEQAEENFDEAGDSSVDLPVTGENNMIEPEQPETSPGDNVTQEPNTDDEENFSDESGETDDNYQESDSDEEHKEPDTNGEGLDEAGDSDQPETSPGDNVTQEPSIDDEENFSDENVETDDNYQESGDDEELQEPDADDDENASNESEENDEDEKEPESEESGIDYILRTFRLMSAQRFKLVDILADDAIDTKLVAVSPSGTTYENPKSSSVTIYDDEVGKWQFFASLNNMVIKDHVIQEGAVYEYPLPEALIPMDDVLEEGEDAPDPNDISTWRLLVSNGNAQARGCIEKTAGGRYNLLIVFLQGTIDGEIDITVSYQYGATLDSSKAAEDGRVDIPFEKGDTYSVSVKERPAAPKTYLTKTVEWITDEGVETGSATSSNGDRRAKFTVTFTNPNPGQPFTGTITDTVGNYSLFFLWDQAQASSDPKLDLDLTTSYSYYGDSSTVYYWLNKTMVDGKPIGMPPRAGSQATSLDKKVTLAFSGSNSQYNRGKTVYGSMANGGPYKLYDSITVSLNDLSFDTFSYSYTVNCLDCVSLDTSGVTSRQYSTTTHLEGGGISESLVGAAAVREYSPVTVDGLSVEKRFVRSYASYNTTTNCPVYTFDATISPNGSDWVALKLSSEEDYIGLYTLISGGSGNQYTVNGKTENAGRVGYADPVSLLEADDYFSVASLSTYSGEIYSIYTYQFTLEDGRDITMLFSPDVIEEYHDNQTYGLSGANARSENIPLQYVKGDKYSSQALGMSGYGAPYPVTVYLFGLRGKPIDFTYQKYGLVHDYIPQSVNYNFYGQSIVGESTWKESIYCQNVCTRDFREPSTVDGDNVQSSFLDQGDGQYRGFYPYLSQRGYVQEDGSVRFSSLWDFSKLKSFLDRWNETYYDESRSNIWGSYDSVPNAFRRLHYDPGSYTSLKNFQCTLSAFLSSDFSLYSSSSRRLPNGSQSSYTEQGLLTSYSNSPFIGQDSSSNICSALIKNATQKFKAEINGDIGQNGGLPANSYLLRRTGSSYMAPDILNGRIANTGGNSPFIWLMLDGTNLNRNASTKFTSHYVVSPKDGYINNDGAVESKVLFQAWHHELQHPIAEEAFVQRAVYPKLNKQIFVELNDEDTNKEMIKSTIATTNLHSNTFSGVFNIHDDMSSSYAYTLKENSPSKEMFKEPLAKHVKLESLTIHFSGRFGDSITFSSIHDGVNEAKVGLRFENPFTDSSEVTAYLTYYSGAETPDHVLGSQGLGNNMQGGFNLKIANLCDVSDIRIEYTCSFDAEEYAVAADAYGVVHTLFSNAVKPNYALLSNTNNFQASASTSGFSFAAQPDAMLERITEKDAENRASGLYVNNFHGELDVGVKAAPEVYIAIQANKVEELFLSGGVKNDVSISDILPYLKVENLDLKVGSRRSVEGLTSIYSGGASSSDIYTVEVVSTPQETLKDAPVPSKKGTPEEGDSKKIDGNLLCLKITRKDGKTIDPQTFFDVTFDIRLTADVVNGKTFRSVESYAGGVLTIQPQLSICFPFTARGRIMTMASTTDTWVSAGAYVSAGYLTESTVNKTSLGSDRWRIEYVIGSAGKTDKVSFKFHDVLKTFVKVNGELADDSLNEALVKKLFENMTVTVTSIKYGKPEANTEYYPQISGPTPPTFTSDVGPFSDTFEYLGTAESGDDGHGWGSEEILRLSGTDLEHLSSVLAEYEIKVDWQSFYEDAVSDGLLLEDDLVVVSKYVNTLDKEDVETSGSFNNPATILGTIEKKSQADWKKHEITWTVSLDVSGDTIRDYTLSDIMSSGRSSSPPSESDVLALKAMNITGFTIYEVLGDQRTPLYTYSGPFTAGTAVSLTDNDHWTGGTLKFRQNCGFIFKAKTFSEGTLDFEYTTKLDIKSFLMEGGSLDNGYAVTNTASASAAGIKIDAMTEESYNEPSGQLKKEVFKSSLQSGASRRWVITAPINSIYSKDIVVRDRLNVSTDSILPFIDLEYMKVELVNRGTTELLYEKGTGVSVPVDNLAKYNGTFNELPLNKQGDAHFELKFDEISLTDIDNASIVVTYEVSFDEDAYLAAKAISPDSFSEYDRYKITNSAFYSQAGWTEQSVTKDEFIEIKDSVTKKGTIFTAAGKDQNAIVEWTVDVHFSDIANQEELKVAEESGGGATIIDSLPYGLKWCEDPKSYISTILDKNSSHPDQKPLWQNGSKLTEEDFEVQIDPENPQRLIVKVYKPYTYQDIRLTFYTEATANLGSVTNSISVSVSGKTNTDWSEPVEDVYTSRNGGSITSRNVPKAVFEALKTVNGSVPDETFTFSIKQVQRDESGGWVDVPGGYTATAESVAGGTVTFPETGYLNPGDYYFLVSEVPDHKKDSAEYEGTAYVWDERSYIIHAQTYFKDNSYHLLKDVIEVIGGEADLSTMPVPVFNNETKPLREVKVVKTWNDGGDLRSLRPNEITVQLYRNGLPYKTLGTYTQKLNASNGWSYTWNDLPANGDYTVKELKDYQNSEYYEEGESSVSTDGVLTTVNLENHLTTGNLSVSKTVTGSAGEKNRDWTFKITLNDKTVDGVYGDMTFIAGVATITLRHGETKTAENLPAGTTYTVIEMEADSDRYKTTVENGSGTILPNETVTATFNNKRNIAINLPDTGGLGRTTIIFISVIVCLAGAAVVLTATKRRLN